MLKRTEKLEPHEVLMPVAAVTPKCTQRRGEAGSGRRHRSPPTRRGAGQAPPHAWPPRTLGTCCVHSPRGCCPGEGGRGGEKEGTPPPLDSARRECSRDETNQSKSHKVEGTSKGGTNRALRNIGDDHRGVRGVNRGREGPAPGAEGQSRGWLGRAGEGGRWPARWGHMVGSRKCQVLAAAPRTSEHIRKNFLEGKHPGRGGWLPSMRVRYLCLAHVPLAAAWGCRGQAM